MEDSEAIGTQRTAEKAPVQLGPKPMSLRKKVALGIFAIFWGGLVSLATISNLSHENSGRSETAVPTQAKPSPTNSAAPVLLEKPQDPASIYVERVETYWLPEVEAIPDAVPANDDAVGAILTQIDGLALNVEDGEKLNLTPAQDAIHTKLIKALSRKQAKLLPRLRKRYAEALDAKLFRRDIRVSASGSTIILVGSVFIRNANVEDMQTAMQTQLTHLRFRRADYRWSPSAGGTLTYEIESPGDAAVAGWDGSRFSTMR